MAQSETILSNQSHPGDSTIESHTGEKFKGDGYYGRADGLHTVQYNSRHVELCFNMICVCTKGLKCNVA
mgnify:CR=1 FL=1